MVDVAENLLPRVVLCCCCEDTGEDRAILPGPIDARVEQCPREKRDFRHCEISNPVLMSRVWEGSEVGFNIRFIISAGQNGTVAILASS